MPTLTIKREPKTYWGENRVLPDDKPVHEWYRFVLAFPPHLVRIYMERFDLNPGQCLLDPFCGTGTSMVEGKLRGLHVVGLDVNPVACLAARVKTSWDKLDPKALRSALRVVIREAEKKCQSIGLVDQDLPLFGQGRGKSPCGELPHLSEQQQRLLLKDSISPLPLAKLLIHREAIRETGTPTLIEDALLLALAKCAVADASNLGFGPEVYVLPKKKKDAPVQSLYERQVLQMASDIESLSPPSRNQSNPDTPRPEETGRGVSALRRTQRKSWEGCETTILMVDARQMSEELRGRRIHAVITSPPYPNEKDYTRAVRLELVLLGYLRDRKDLRALKENFLRSNSRNIFVGDEDDKYLNGNHRVNRLAQAIEARRNELGKTSGFERMYHKVVRQFFGGMARHLQTLKEFLAPGAHLAYVVGDQASFFLVHIHTAEILAEIAQEHGYEVVGIDLWRERRATASGALLREDVLVLRFPG